MSSSGTAGSPPPAPRHDLLAANGTHVGTRHADRLVSALRLAGLDCTRKGAPDGTLRVDADPELVGCVAHQAGVPLTELRAADGAGLEEMFLELTADTQRETHHDGHAPARQEGAVA